MIELRATEYNVTGTDFTITASPAKCCKTNLTQLCNGQKFCLITCLSFPSVTTLVPVQIEINGNTYPVLDYLGNTLMSDQIRSRRCYKLTFGTYQSHFIVKQCLPPSQATPSCVAATAPSTATANYEVEYV